GQPRDFSDQKWFSRAANEQQFIVGDPVISRFTNTWIVPMAYPLYNKRGEFVGVMQMGFDSAQYQFILDGATLPSDSVISIVNDTGVVVARAPVSDNL